MNFNKIIITSGFIFFILLLSNLSFAAKVSRVVGYVENPKTQSNTGIPKEFKIETSEEIEQAMNIVKIRDIKYFRFLTKLQKDNLNEFMLKIKIWFEENDSVKIDKEKNELLKLQENLRKELKNLSNDYKKETVEENKKNMVKKSKEIIGKLFKAERDYEKLIIKIKSQEIALLETKLDSNLNEKSSYQDSYVNRYFPDTAAAK